MEKLVLNYLGKDFMEMDVYQDADGVLLKDIDFGELNLHTVSGDFDGDPNVSISKVKKYQGREIVIVGKEDEPTPEEKFNYQLLGRLKSDCDYFLGFGNRSIKHLWAQDIDEQIEKMKELHNGFPEGKKPEWLTWEEILNYEEKMKSS